MGEKERERDKKIRSGMGVAGWGGASFWPQCWTQAVTTPELGAQSRKAISLPKRHVITHELTHLISIYLCWVTRELAS